MIREYDRVPDTKALGDIVAAEHDDGELIIVLEVAE